MYTKKFIRIYSLLDWLILFKGDTREMNNPSSLIRDKIEPTSIIGFFIEDSHKVFKRILKDIYPSMLLL